MPELADVEGWRRYWMRYARGRRVRRVRVRDRDVLRNTSPQGLGRALAGRRLGTAERHGKWLYAAVGRGLLVLHFGMTGALVFRGRARSDDLHDFDRLVLECERGELRYRTQRKLGGVWWVADRRRLADVTGPLGPDAKTISRSHFRERLAGRRGALKSALMDQTLLAGLGNELSDEILWRARERPDTRVPDLSEERIDRVYRAMQQVLGPACRHGRIPQKGRWLNAVRHDEGARCPRCGAAVRRTREAGRTACWCPRCQS